MKECMIDTDILSAFFRGEDKVVNKMNDYLKEYNNLNISIITYYEILNGLMYKDTKNQLAKFEEFAALNNVIPLTSKMAKKAAEIQASLRKKGSTIGHTDTLIAGTAVVSDLTLITNNTKHFKRVKGLKIDNWLV